MREASREAIRAASRDAIRDAIIGISTCRQSPSGSGKVRRLSSEVALLPRTAERKAATCTVLPSPISSARSPPLRLVYLYLGRNQGVNQGCTQGYIQGCTQSHQLRTASTATARPRAGTIAGTGSRWHSRWLLVGK